MKNIIKLVLGLAMLAASNRLSAQGTAFTYQGQLYSAGSVANGNFDFTFTLFPTPNGGLPASLILTNFDIAVTNGLFVVSLDFGPGYFNGANYWLESGVRTNGAGGFTILTPRQPVTPSPYAIFATTANAANTAGSISGNVTTAQLSGAVSNSQLAHASILIVPGPGLSGGGSVALGGSITVSNSGVISITGNADITVSTSGGAVTLGDTATSTNTAGAIVRRNESGNFSAGTITLSGTVNLTNAQNNTGVGSGVFANNTTGNANTAFGFKALFANTTGSSNIALGNLAGFGITTGSSNIDIGNSGLAADANVIRLGSGQSQTFLAGSLSVNGTEIVSSSGNWVGSPTGLVGPPGPAGQAGTNGATGLQGTQGPPGPAGTNGSTIRSGTVAPTSTLGTNGDFYINTSGESIYGPKTASGWGGSVSLIGAQGVAGSSGAAGPVGTNGNTIWSGNGTPSLAVGTNGDFYLNTNGEAIYGPKTVGGWGNSVSLVGPQGLPGSTGPAGPGATLAALNIKAGSVTGSVSSTGVANLGVTFTTPFATTNYAISLSPRVYTSNSQQITVSASYTSKATNGFTVNLVTDLLAASSGFACDWTAMPYSNP